MRKVLAGIVAILLMAILAGAVVVLLRPDGNGHTMSARARADVMCLNWAVRMYRMEQGRLPASLEDLARPPGGGQFPGEPYLEQIPPDPWGGAYVLRVENGEAHVLSAGPDGREGTADDIDPGRKARGGGGGGA